MKSRVRLLFQWYINMHLAAFFWCQWHQRPPESDADLSISIVYFENLKIYFWRTEFDKSIMFTEPPQRKVVITFTKEAKRRNVKDVKIKLQYISFPKATLSIRTNTAAIFHPINAANACSTCWPMPQMPRTVACAKTPRLTIGRWESVQRAGQCISRKECACHSFEKKTKVSPLKHHFTKFTTLGNALRSLGERKGVLQKRNLTYYFLLQTL